MSVQVHLIARTIGVLLGSLITSAHVNHIVRFQLRTEDEEYHSLGQLLHTGCLLHGSTQTILDKIIGYCQYDAWRYSPAIV